ncbi:MAG: hypothetical protein ACYCYH_04340 [Steroidobacteraceae bacterium]
MLNTTSQGKRASAEDFDCDDRLGLMLSATDVPPETGARHASDSFNPTARRAARRFGPHASSELSRRLG